MQQIKQFRLSILHKGLILLLTPLLLESLLFWQLEQLTAKTAELAAFEKRQSILVERINYLITSFAEAGGTVYTYVFTGSPTSRLQGQNQIQDVLSQCDEVKALAGNDPSVLALMDHLHELVEMEFHELEVMKPLNSTSDYQAMIDKALHMRVFVKESYRKMQILRGMLKEQRRTLEAARERGSQAREKFAHILTFGIFGNLALAMVLLAIFVVDIRGRLKVLVENARCIPKGVEMPGLVSGSDELNYLDGVLHQAACELKEAREMRQSLMEMIAHDLRSPLMSSQVAVDLVKNDRETSLGKSASRNIEVVNRNIEKLVALVNDLLTLEKLEAGKMELALAPQSLRAIVDDSIASVSGLSSLKELSVKNDCLDETVMVDRARIEQVLVNYLSNAIKFSPQGATISVCSGREEDRVLVSVIDQGPGLSLEDQTKLFNKFFQLKDVNSGKGFGLGLAICKMVCESHGGRVGVESEPGKGARFWFSIPL